MWGPPLAAPTCRTRVAAVENAGASTTDYGRVALQTPTPFCCRTSAVAATTDAAAAAAAAAAAGSGSVLVMTAAATARQLPLVAGSCDAQPLSPHCPCASAVAAGVVHGGEAANWVARLHTCPRRCGRPQHCFQLHHNNRRRQRRRRSSSSKSKRRRRPWTPCVAPPTRRQTHRWRTADRRKALASALDDLLRPQRFRPACPASCPATSPSVPFARAAALPAAAAIHGAPPTALVVGCTG